MGIRLSDEQLTKLYSRLPFLAHAVADKENLTKDKVVEILATVGLEIDQNVMEQADSLIRILTEINVDPKIDRKQGLNNLKDYGVPSEFAEPTIDILKPENLEVLPTMEIPEKIEIPEKVIIRDAYPGIIEQGLQSKYPDLANPVYVSVKTLQSGNLDVSGELKLLGNIEKDLNPGYSFSKNPITGLNDVISPSGKIVISSSFNSSGRPQISISNPTEAADAIRIKSTSAIIRYQKTLPNISIMDSKK